MTSSNQSNNDWTIIFAVLAVIVFFAFACEPKPSDGCYDADPTQWTEMVCPGE
jgi:hypothetical protein